MPRILPVSRKLDGLTQEEIENAIPYPDSPRPSEMKVEDCCYPDAPRPCPLVSCKFNNYLNPTDNGTILLNWPSLQPWEVPPEMSCANDVANRGQSPDDPLTFDEMAPIIGATRQAAEQGVARAQKSFKQAWKEAKQNG